MVSPSLLRLIFILSFMYPFTRDLLFGVFHYFHVCISHVFHSVSCQDHFKLLLKEFLANCMSVSINYKAYHLQVSATFYDFLQRKYRTFHHNLVFKCYQFISTGGIRDNVLGPCQMNLTN